MISNRLQATLEIRRNLVIEVCDCATCGVEFGLTADYQRHMLQSHQIFYCPNGHHNFYSGETEAERLKRELSNTQSALASVRAELATTKHSRAAVSGELTKFKTRVQNGVCPCCHRHFVNLERHMHNKHADFPEGEP